MLGEQAFGAGSSNLPRATTSIDEHDSAGLRFVPLRAGLPICAEAFLSVQKDGVALELNEGTGETRCWALYATNAHRTARRSMKQAFKPLESMSWHLRCLAKLYMFTRNTFIMLKR